MIDSANLWRFDLSSMTDEDGLMREVCQGRSEEVTWLRFKFRVTGID